MGRFIFIFLLRVVPPPEMHYIAHVRFRSPLSPLSAVPATLFKCIYTEILMC